MEESEREGQATTYKDLPKDGVERRNPMSITAFVKKCITNPKTEATPLNRYASGNTNQ
jgi:hypothetical protein